MGKIARYLNQLTIGDVFDTPEVLEAYATDRSILRIKPKLVAVPENTEDIQKLLRFSSQLATKGIKLPVTVRGSGLDEMGADLGNGMIISTEKLNKLLEADKRERMVRVQAGITLRELNTALSVYGLTIPIEGHDNETIGGLISNCPADSLSSKYGGIRKFVARMEVVLPNGDILQTARIKKHTVKKKSRGKAEEGKLYGKALQLLKKNEPLIKVLKNNPSSLAGYHNIIKIADKSTLDFLPLFFGAQGTLGVITEVILKTVPLQTGAKRVAMVFKNYADAEKLLELAKSLKPLSIDIYDLRAVKMTEANGKKPNDITKKYDKGFVVLAKFDNKSKSKVKKLERFFKKSGKKIKLVTETNKNVATLNDLESTLTSFINYTKLNDATPLMLGFSLPKKNTDNFLREIAFLESKLGIDLVFYGSFSANNYNLSPKFDMHDKDFPKKATNFLKTSAYIVKRQNGIIAGGLPEGRIKALATVNEMTEAEKNLYIELKNIFDRQNILNPNIKTNFDVRFTVRHFRSL